MNDHLMLETRAGQCTAMEDKYFPNTFLATLHILLMLTFIHCRYKSIVAKLITLQISHYTESKIIFPCILLNIHNIK